MLSGINQTSQMASLLFSKIDTKNQGYIEKSDLASAFSQLTSDSSNDSSIDSVFATLDSDSDGKVTESELTTVLNQLHEQLDSEFNRMRMQGGMPPPPPPANDEGFTEDELKAQLEEIGDTDSTRSALISKIVDNFAAADTDGDGKVSFAEAMAYDESTQTAASSETTSTTASSSEAQVMRKIMELLHAYRSDDAGSGLSTLLSVSA
ncbi:MAG: EF-hand domain-containing protein [Dechloromonas sp.]|nr:MAG: EF-hand domain-containing protein [Dechloromonas sp.]